MIRGHFGSLGGRNAPYLRCYLEFPEFPDLEGGEVDFLVDTGADRTTLSRPAAENMGLNLATLPDGGTSTGVGGVSAVRMVESQLLVQSFSITFWLRIWESQHSSMSVLGRDFIRYFALFIEERTGRVLFLDRAEIVEHGLTDLGSP